MTEEKKKTDDETNKKLKNLEQQLNRIEKEFLITSEDQLFFGVLISLLILFITLPINDVVSFLQSTLRIGPDAATRDAEVIKYFGIALFLVSSLLRYYAVVSEGDTSKRVRYVSFEAFWLGLNLILLMVIINIITPLASQFGLGGIAATFWILIPTFIGMSSLERRVLRLYAKKQRILKKDSFLYASRVPLLVVSALGIGVVFEILWILLGFTFSVIGFYIVAIIVIIIAEFFSFLRRKKERES
jgi:hypothetical protein